MEQKKSGGDGTRADHSGPYGHGEGAGSLRGSEQRRDSFHRVSLLILYWVEAGEREVIDRVVFILAF